MFIKETKMFLESQSGLMKRNVMKRKNPAKKQKTMPNVSLSTPKKESCEGLRSKMKRWLGKNKSVAHREQSIEFTVSCDFFLSFYDCCIKEILKTVSNVQARYNLTSK